MTGHAASTGDRVRSLKPLLMWTLAAIAVAFALYLIAGRIERMIARWPHAGQSAVSPGHCAAFIDLAKATYGDAWKARLDPGDATCAIEVQEAWEQQRISRETAADLNSQSAEPVVADSPPPPAPSPAQTGVRSETYCLNVISLAKAKHGADWESKLDPAERAACAQP